MTKEHTCDSCGHPLSKSGYYTAKKRGYCRQCKTPKKHMTVEPPKEEKVTFIPPPFHTSEGVESNGSQPSPPQENSTADDDLEDNSGESTEWVDFEFSESETTEQIPTALKMVASISGEVGKKTPQQIANAHQTNLEILRLSLTGIDVLISKYGQAVTLDEEYMCKHSEEDKNMVATAQYNFMLEKGIDPSSIVGTGALASAMTAYYILPPVLKVRKRAKVKLFKNGLRLFKLPSKIPLIGRFFKKKKPEVVKYE